MGPPPLARAAGDRDREEMLFTAVALIPLAAMLVSLFAAVWIRDAERERRLVAARSRTDEK